MFVQKQEVIFCFGSYLSQKLMDFASIWVILKAKSCWATISEYIRNPIMKLNEYGIYEYAKNQDPLDAHSVVKFHPSETKPLYAIMSLELLMSRRNENLYPPIGMKPKSQLELINSTFTFITVCPLFQRTTSTVL